METLLLLLHLSVLLPWVAGAVQVTVNVKEVATTTEEQFVCLGMDWWPSNKCNWGVCPWGNASILNADLSDRRLRAAVQALSPVYLRVGGSECDSITYDINVTDCPSFSPQPPHNSTWFHGGCLTVKRWAEINDFAKATGAHLIFALNANYGRGTHGGEWDPSNAEALINYSAKNGIRPFAFEYGNELGMNASMFAKGFKQVHQLLTTAYGGDAPLLIGPDEIRWDDAFFTDFLGEVKDILYATTWHGYPLGEGYNNPYLDEHIMDPSREDKWIDEARHATQVARAVAPNLRVWMGESGGASNSGHNGTSNAFIDGFWYINALGGFASAGHGAFCRQTLVGGNYELVDKDTREPNPDYYGALLFQRLMGPKVLNATSTAAEVRSWAHCLKGSTTGGTALLMLNYGNSTETVEFDGVSGADGDLYLLTAPEIHSRVVSLNGKPLRLSGDDIPAMDPSPLPKSFSLPPTSIAFIAFPKDTAPACR